MNSKEYIKSIIKDCINESIDEYHNFNGTFDEFKKAYPVHYQSDRGKGIGGRVYLYAITSHQNLKSLFDNGQDIQFSGTGEGTNWYGAAFYGTWDYNGALANLHSGKGHCYGDTIVKYVLKDGFKDFLILDKGLCKQFGVSKSPSEQLAEILGPEDYKKYDESLRHCDFISQQDQQLGVKFIDKDQDELKSYPGGRYRCGHNGFNVAKNVWEFFKGEPIATKDNGRPFVWQEIALKSGAIRGFVFNGSQDPKTVVVKNFKDVIPVGSITNPPPGKNGEDAEKNVKWDQSNFSETGFNNINNNEDINWRYGGKYNETPYNERSSNGYARVKKGGKYYYVNLEDDVPILDFGVDDATKIGLDGVAKFTVNGEEHSLKILPNGNVMYYMCPDAKGFPKKKEDFIKLLNKGKNNG